MSRSFLIGAAVLAVAGIGFLSQPARSSGPVLVSKVVRKWAPRLTKRVVKSTVGTAASRSRTTVFFLPATDASHVDVDGDNEVNTGDEVIASGDVEDVNGRKVGFWDGTFSHTSDDSSMLHITLRFPGRGTTTISGAPYPDGSPYRDSDGGRFPVTQVVGNTGSVRYRGAAGFGADEDDNLVILLSR